MKTLYIYFEVVNYKIKYYSLNPSTFAALSTCGLITREGDCLYRADGKPVITIFYLTGWRMARTGEPSASINLSGRQMRL